ncbi:helix-turn-helix domain-containing protein [Raoultella sp. Lac2]|uniref:transcriptional regulator n=1 Tax=unclassified Raoultella TaxID=2627600 RepID=UPI00135571C7|nr:helix-turn-helix domain-containing protein [Raoultella sp. Lac2]MXF98886.1 helix-turn-helix domain-containing protein [Raoultella sp. Lac1]
MNDDVRDRLRGLTSQRAIAKRLGITPQAVNQWFNKPHIPPRFVLPICELVRWKVTPHEIRPDLYPGFMDGIPEALRTGKMPFAMSPPATAG